VCSSDLTTAVAVDGQQTANLLEYVGAQIGSDSGSLVDIAEFKAYAEAIDDAQRAWLVEQLLIKYSL